MYLVTTMMNNQQSDSIRAFYEQKKKHIGSNIVNIIFCESDENFDILHLAVSYLFCFFFVLSYFIF